MEDNPCNSNGEFKTLSKDDAAKMLREADKRFRELALTKVARRDRAR